jgi:hypothetical protein
MMSYPAADFIEDLRAKLIWKAEPSRDRMEDFVRQGMLDRSTDPGEGLSSWPMKRTGAGRPAVLRPGRERKVEFVLRDRKRRSTPRRKTGERALAASRSGHYGLGLFRARNIFEATMRRRVHLIPRLDPETNVSFPASGVS